MPISQRPAAANARAEAGHWEADLMLFRTYGQAILVVHERLSRLTRVLRQPSKAARPVRLKPVIDAVYPFADAHRAFAHLDHGPFGRVVIEAR